MKFSFRDSIRWSIFISVVTFLMACLFSVSSTIILEGVAWGIGMLIVLLLILNGIVFDMMGIASTAAKETPFHAMASEKVYGARHAIHIVRNADRFSNFCNDVIGDITGVVSGAATALVVIKLMTAIDSGASAFFYTFVSVVFSGTVSALTVGGKAMGKSFAIHYANDIVLIIGKAFYFVEHRLGIKIFRGKKNKASNGKRGNKRAARTDQPA